MSRLTPPSFLLLLILLICSPAVAEDQTESISQTVQNYLDGTQYGDPELIEAAFAKSLEVQWLGDGDILMRRTAPDYIDQFRDGEYRDRKGSIILIDSTDRAATVKAEIEWNGRRYTDYMLLLKIEGEWKITNKIAVWSDLDSSGAN